MRTNKAYQFISLAIVAGIFSAGFSSCTGKSSKKSSPVAEETIKQEIEEYAYPLPSAFEVTNMLNEIEASYIVGIANDPEKASSYLSEKSKAINLGIYTADLAYATTYNQKNDIQAFFKASETLVRELDFTSAFDQDLADQIEASMDNKDKLVEIVTDMFQNAYSYLNKQGRTELSYLVLSGTVIEGLYLTTHISENTFQNPKIIEAILFQKEPLAELEKMLAYFEGSELLSDVQEDIKRINAIYAQEEGTTSMTEKQVLELTETLTKIRENLVK
ncbi:hypothetical protein [Gaoshiqia sediminis]|uniref:Lipoprotein n=1 Tax=Gaoshiqia sediminis TaxID=2986998 RepID=A0AA41Y6A4_9BACT|nr:hypothetical protein [Gaoshiqia sediminis]MCW0481912.1 hypothetical protein [Gaoshiqia sediminis]